MNNPYELIRIQQLMKKTKGSKKIKIGLIDGPVQSSHKLLQSADITLLGNATCITQNSSCTHGTFMAGILAGTQGSGAPGICPVCPLLIRSVFNESNTSGIPVTSTLKELSKAILETIDAGAKIINLSLGTITPQLSDYPPLYQTLDYAFQKHVLIFAASGNQGRIGVIPLTNHPWIIPVAACDITGHPYSKNNLGITIGKKGILAPGVNITSTIPLDKLTTMSGTSVAVPFASATAALLWSIYPDATARDIHKVILLPTHPRKSIIPPLIDGEESYRLLKNIFE